MGLLDNEINSISLNDFLVIIKRNHHLLEPFAVQMWNSMTKVDYDETQKREVAEYRDNIVSELESLLQLLNLYRMFSDKELKKIHWEKLGDTYHQAIISQLSTLISQSITEWKDYLTEGTYDQNCNYVESFLKKMPTSIDIKDGIVSDESLIFLINTVKDIIRELNGITGKDMNIAQLISSFNAINIPCKNSYYRDIYDVLDRLDFIPQKTKEAHANPGSPYYRENYIKSFYKRIK